MKEPEDLTPEELDDLVRQCLAEVLNAAANIAEMQLDDGAREEIYAMCDLVSSYYDIERTVIDDHGELLPIEGSLRVHRLGERFRVIDADDAEDT